MLFYMFTPMHILLHIHVLTCVNVPIRLGHVTTQNKHGFTDSYIINHSFINDCIHIAHFLYIHNDNYYTHVKVYMITCHMCTCWKFLMLKIIMFINLYDHMPYMYYLYHNSYFIIYIVHLRSCGAILSLIAYHMQS